jgi:Ca-activated chloride channel family protein
MTRRALVLVCGLAVALAGCARDTRPTSTIDLADPGHCAPVDVTSDPAVAPILDKLAGQFNTSPAARLDEQRCAFVRVHAMTSADATERLTEGWTDADEVGPAPALWVPASTAWTTVANGRQLGAPTGISVRPGRSLARTPLVIAMPEPMARVLGWPRRSLGWRDLARVAAQPRGWGALGHPEWGAFRLGKPNPNWSTDGLLASTAQVRLGDEVARALEASVIYYGDTSWIFLDNLHRVDDAHRPLTYVSAVVTDQRAVDDYNEAEPRIRLAAIVPNDTNLAHDFPLAPVQAPWVTAGARAGAAAFSEFVTMPEAQKEATDAGFDAGGARTDPSAPAYLGAQSAQDHWAQIRKRARVLLLFDVSDSMGDAADPRDPDSPPKIAKAKAALRAALSQLAPDDEVGLRVFTTDAGNVKDRTWADVVPVGPLKEQKGALERAIKALQPRRGSPLYAATRAAYDKIATTAAPRRINGVVLLTDGHNEYDPDNDRAALLTHLRGPVRVFTIAYSGEADMGSVRRIAQATDARAYDAADPDVIEDVYAAVLANF